MNHINQFLDYINGHYDEDGKRLIYNFFITFSRFECALKNSIEFASPKRNSVEPDWDKFIKSIKNDFKMDRTDKLAAASNSLLLNPPKKQSIEKRELIWIDRTFNANTPDINKLCQHIRDVRNNLFHGGKFHGKYERDESRNYTLLNSSMTVLDEWLRLSPRVYALFTAPLL